jgi:DNA-binding NarL/FixJ family response regulator
MSVGLSDYEAAYACYEEALALRREAGDKQLIANTLNNMGVLAYHRADFDQAYKLYSESLNLRKEAGDRLGVAYALLNLGSVLLEVGDYGGSKAFSIEGLEIARETHDARTIADASRILACACIARGDYTEAAGYLRESIQLFWEVRQPLYVIYCLENLASLLVKVGEHKRAAILHGFSACAREELASPLQLSDIEDYERDVQAVQSALGVEARAQLHAEGARMRTQEAITYALETIGSLVAPKKRARSQGAQAVRALTLRETEVLRLLAQGLTDAQIAERLHVSVHTVNTHTRNIYSKLGVTSRAAATRYAIEHKI